MTLKEKSYEESNYGQNPYKRTIEQRLKKGVIIIDKDEGHTSHQQVEFLKKILNIKKAGHSGTLDPNVTGVLPIGLGKATRLMEYMLLSDKEYICSAYFHKPLNKEQIETIFKEFQGEITQTPPIVSSVKRQPRKRKIYSLHLLDTKKDNQYVLFRVRCERGTYIRKLCTDMGEYIGINAQMVELRRTKAGVFREEDNIIGLDKLRNLYELYKEEGIKQYRDELLKYIKPMEEIIDDFNKVIVKDSALQSISHGHDLALPGVISYSENIKKDDTIAVLTQKNELIAMGKSLMDKEEFEQEKGFCVKIEKVITDPINNHEAYEQYQEENN